MHVVTYNKLEFKTIKGGQICAHITYIKYNEDN